MVKIIMSIINKFKDDTEFCKKLIELGNDVADKI